MNLRAAAVICLAGVGCRAHVVETERLAPANLLAVTYVHGGFWEYQWTRGDIYARLPTGDSQYVGTVNAGPLGGMGAPHTKSWRDRYRDFAISDDGRSIVFLHSTDLAPKKGGPPASGIYRYLHGTGIVQAYRVGSSAYNDWRGLGSVPRPMPADLLPFEEPSRDSLGRVVWGVRATGETTPLALFEGNPLHRAAFDGRTDECETLVRAGTDVASRTHWGFTPLQLALIGGHEETALRLLRLGAVAPRGSLEWGLAAQLGHTRVIEALLQNGVDVNATDPAGNTLLHRSAAAAVNSVDVNGFFVGITTPEHQIRTGASKRVMQLLLDRGINRDLRNDRGQTALDIITARIDTTPPPTPIRRPRWMVWAFLNDRANATTESAMAENARRRAAFNAHLMELRSLLEPPR